MSNSKEPPLPWTARLVLLRELLLQQDIPEPQGQHPRYRECVDYWGFRAAAAAWGTHSEEEEFWDHLEHKGWVSIRPKAEIGDLAEQMGAEHPAVWALDARLWVEEHTRRDSLSQQSFIAMLVNQAVRGEVSDTIEGAIQDAGYTPRLINRDLRTHSIPDQVMHQLRKSLWSRI